MERSGLTTSQKLTCAVSVLIAALLVGNASGHILQHPESITVAVNEWANFSCSANCSQNMAIRWRLNAPLLGVVNEHYLNSKPLSKRWSRKGITIEQETADSESSDFEMQTIMVQATSQMNGAVIQCAAISTRNSAGSSYSKFAILEVEPQSSQGS